MDTDPNGQPFPELKNDCILRVLNGQKVEFVPVWLMRQAGRHLPEYNEAYKDLTFAQKIGDPKIVTDVTLMPVRRYKLDAAIIYSDILVINQALGQKIIFDKKMTLQKPLKIDGWKNQINHGVNIATTLKKCYEAITMTRHALEGQCPLIGFSGGPWTLMAYMIDGENILPPSESKTWFYKYPEESRELIKIISDKIIDHLFEQVRAGAQALQIFESKNGDLNPDLYEEFIYPETDRICREVKQKLKSTGGKQVPIIVCPKFGHFALDLLGKEDNSVDAISLDWTIVPEDARKITKKPLQGNLDNTALLASPEQVRRLTKKMLKAFGAENLIANMGDGINKSSRNDCVEAFIDVVHEESRKMLSNK